MTSDFLSNVRRTRSVLILLCAILAPASNTAATAEPAPVIDVATLDLASVQQGLRTGRFTSRALSAAYLARIAQYNPTYNAIITPNPDALRDADAADQRRRAGTAAGVLDGVPIVIKDTIDVAGLPTTAGWRALSARAGGIDLIPETDAPAVARLRAAGAVILGKTNVPVFSLSAQHANDSWAGPTLNAMAPSRQPGGSSAGSATAVAASFATFALGEETGGSIQYPAGFQALVGIKPTFALVPNTGVVPLGGSTRDVVGPLARTVADAAAVLDVLAGYTPADQKTAAAIGHVPPRGYRSALAGATLRGQRIGLYGPGWLDQAMTPETARLYARAIALLRRQGAIVIVDPFAGSDFAAIAHPTGGWRYDQRGEEAIAFDLENFLRRLGPSAAIHSIRELVTRTGEDPFALGGLLAYEREQPAFLASLQAPSVPPDLSGFIAARQHYLETFDAVMTRNHLDAMVFPQTLAESPPLFSDEQVDSPTVSQINIGGFPGIVVPAGEYPSGTPFGLMFMGRLWDEPRLLRLAAAFERIAPARRAALLVAKPSPAPAPSN
jgi:aspartyl-tRNA(Asn)/glutamyl-tRNA(Gln) amidotransferase subunit A